jgi:AcrR family transcriptional regulator
VVRCSIVTDMADVKSTSRAEAAGRSDRLTQAERSARTRQRIARAAYDLFASDGYAATTMEAVAKRAGVAVQTVYFVFHTKAQLMVASVKVAGGGEEATEDVMARSWIQAVRAAPDGPRRLALIAEHGTLIYRRLGPVWPAILAAMGEPDVRVAWQDIVDGRRAGMRSIVHAMAERRELRDGLAPEVAADILFGLHRHELYLAFTDECGWSFDRFRAWLFVTLCTQLLPVSVATEAVRVGAPATADLELGRAIAEVGV